MNSWRCIWDWGKVHDTGNTVSVCLSAWLQLIRARGQGVGGGKGFGTGGTPMNSEGLGTGGGARILMNA